MLGLRGAAHRRRERVIPLLAVEVLLQRRRLLGLRRRRRRPRRRLRLDVGQAILDRLEPLLHTLEAVQNAAEGILRLHRDQSSPPHRVLGLKP
ncbi:MAG: hypothetical protein ACYTDU_16460 [Planctomycetota bacterium]